jgi:hypothetical protein
MIVMQNFKLTNSAVDGTSKAQFWGLCAAVALFSGLGIANNFIETNHKAAAEAFHTAVAEGNMEFVYGMHDGLVETGATIDPGLASDIHATRGDRNRLAAYIFTPLYEAGYEGAISGTYDADDLAAVKEFTEDYPELMRDLGDRLATSLDQEGMDPHQASRIGVMATMQAVLEAGDSRFDEAAIKENTDNVTYEAFLEDLTGELAKRMAPQINAGLVSDAGASYMNYLSGRADDRFLKGENGRETIYGFRKTAKKIRMTSHISPWDRYGEPPHVSSFKKRRISNARDSNVSLPVENPFMDVAIAEQGDHAEDFEF